MMVMAPQTSVKLATPGTAPAHGVVFNAKSAVALVNERRIDFVRARNVRVIGKVDDTTGAIVSTGATGKKAAKVLVERDAIERLLTWKHARKIGPGFANLGNTCYLNSVLQCLAYTPSLAQYLLEKDVIAMFGSGGASGASAFKGFHKHQHQHANTKGAGGFCGVRVMSRLLQTIHSSGGNGAGRVLQPRELVMNLRHVSKSFRIGRQEDAHEFFRLLVDAMQRSCLRKAHIKLETHPAAATTLVGRTFRGTLRNTLKCAKCQFVSERHDDFFDLSLELSHGVSSVRTALKHFTAVETLDASNAWKCSSCKQLSCAEKGLTIASCPNVLVLQLKRFDALYGKIKKHIAFDTTLDLAPRMAKGTADRTRGRCKYDLYAVLVHAGYSTDCGHYYAFVRGSSGQWYEMNDESVRWVSVETVLQQKAYMLFYTRVLPASERPAAKAKADTPAVPETTASGTASGAKATAEEIPDKVDAAALANGAKAKTLDMNGFLASLKTTITSASDAETAAAADAPENSDVREAKGAALQKKTKQVVVTFNVTKRRSPVAPAAGASSHRAVVPVFSGRVGRFVKFARSAWRSSASILEMTRDIAEVAVDDDIVASVAPAPKLTVEDVVATTAAVVAPQVATAKTTKVHFDPRQMKNIGVKSAALFGKSVDKWNETHGWADDSGDARDTSSSADTTTTTDDLDRTLAAQHDRVMSKLKSEDWKHRNAARQDYWDETLDAGKVKKVKKRKDFVANQGASNKFQLQLHKKKQRRHE